MSCNSHYLDLNLKMLRKYVCMAGNSERNTSRIMNCYGRDINDTVENVFSKQRSTIIFFQLVIRTFFPPF